MPKLKIMMIMYSIGFYIPFIISLFLDSRMALLWWVKVTIFAVGVLTQFLFFGIELVQLRFRWRTYFKGFWNWVEFSQFFLYVAYAV